MTRKDYYQTLGIEKTASKSEIIKAYRNLALKWHPDSFVRGNSLAKTLEEAEKKIKELNEAFEILGDEDKKREYDSGENVVVENYGYDYEEKMPSGESALEKYVGVKGDKNWIYANIYNLYVGLSGQEIISDYHLIRAQKLLQVINSYYYPIYKKIGNWNKFKDEYVSTSKDNGLVWMSGITDSGWEGAIRNFKEIIDYARKKIGLPKLTDVQAGILKIENGVISVEKYNDLYFDRKHASIVEYWKIRGKIYDTAKNWEKYKAFNTKLLKEIEDKAAEAEKGSFRKIWVNDNEEKIGEIKKFNKGKLRKMEEAMVLMKRIIEEGENWTPQVEDAQTKDKKQIEEEINARNNLSKKKEELGSKIERLVNEAGGLIGDYEKLEAKINEIEKYQEEEAYQEYQEDVEELKTKLNELDKDKYREGVSRRVEDKLKEVGEKESGLSEEEKNDLEKIKNGSVTELNKINEVENKIVARISKKNFSNLLNNLLEEANELVKNIAKGTADKLKKLRKGLYNFQFNSNVYCQEIFKEKETEVESALNKLATLSYPETSQGEDSWFRPEVVIPVSLVSFLVIGIVLVIRKSRK
jgi:hypothetical protein